MVAVCRLHGSLELEILSRRASNYNDKRLLHGFEVVLESDPRMGGSDFGTRFEGEDVHVYICVGEYFTVAANYWPVVMCTSSIPPPHTVFFLQGRSLGMRLMCSRK